MPICINSWADWTEGDRYRSYGAVGVIARTDSGVHLDAFNAPNLTANPTFRVPPTTARKSRCNTSRTTSGNPAVNRSRRSPSVRGCSSARHTAAAIGSRWWFVSVVGTAVKKGVVDLTSRDVGGADVKERHHGWT
jgi:hypothetical protein